MELRRSSGFQIRQWPEIRNEQRRAELEAELEEQEVITNLTRQNRAIILSIAVCNCWNSGFARLGFF